MSLKIKKIAVVLACFGLCSSIYAANIDVISSNSFKGSGELENIVDKICIDGYVYINIYQRKPVMTIQYGSATSLVQYPVMQGLVQSIINNAGKILPERCTASK